MRDYMRRILIAAFILLFVSFLFLGGRHSQAETPSLSERTIDWTWPSEGIISDTFNTRNGNHKGIDIAGDLGDAVYVVDDGIVTRSYFSQSYGNVIFVKHDNELETVYAHLNTRDYNENDVVKRGDKIGEMGNTGHSSGVHLHFEIHNKEWTVTKENAIDPILVLGEVVVGQTVTIAATTEEVETEQVEQKVEQPNSFKMGLLQQEELKMEKNVIVEGNEEIHTAEEAATKEDVQVDGEQVTVLPYKKSLLFMKSNIDLKKVEGSTQGDASNALETWKNQDIHLFSPFHIEGLSF